MSCGDEGRAFFHRRQTLHGLESHGDSIYAIHEWQEIADIRLNATILTDPCFSTAFSPSGHVCAIGSQYGTVTVFDTTRIRAGMEDDEAVIDVLKSSRPLVTGDHNNPGAVRSMAFGPSPWDFLAWAEDRGRFCITDLRDGFRSRQTIQIDLDSNELDRVDLSTTDKPRGMEQEELEREAQFVQRHQEALNSQDDFAAVRHAADYMEEAAERRRRVREIQRQNSNDPSPNPVELTDAEREILESLRVQRLSEARGEPHDAEGIDRPFSIHYLNPPSSTSSPIPSTRSHNIQQYLRERNGRTSTSSSRAFPPRRRQSVVISNSNAHSTNNSSSRPAGLTPARNFSSLSASPSRIASNPTTPSSASRRAMATSIVESLRNNNSNAAGTSPDDPWQTISAAMTSIPARNAPEDSPSRVSEDATSRDEALLRTIQNSESQELNRQERRRELENARAQILFLTTTHPSEYDTLATESSSDLTDQRLQARLRQRERESTLRRERLRSVQSITAEAEAISRIEPIDRTRLTRLRQLRDRAGQLEGEFRSTMENEATTIMSYLRGMGGSSLGGMEQSGGEPYVQGLGWGVEGREL